MLESFFFRMRCAVFWEGGMYPTTPVLSHEQPLLPNRRLAETTDMGVEYF